MSCLPKDAHAGKSPSIVCDEFAGVYLHSQQVLRSIHCGDLGVGAGVDPGGFAATRVAHDVTRFVMIRPSSLGASHVLPLHENP